MFLKALLPSSRYLALSRSPFLFRGCSLRVAHSLSSRRASFSWPAPITLVGQAANDRQPAFGEIRVNCLGDRQVPRYSGQSQGPIVNGRFRQYRPFGGQS